MEENVNVVSGDIGTECEKEAQRDLLVLSTNPIVYQNMEFRQMNFYVEETDSCKGVI